MAIKLNRKIIDILNDNTTEIELSIYDDIIWRMEFKGVLDIDEDGRIVCLQSIERAMVSTKIINSMVNITITNKKIKNFKITGLVEEVLNNGKTYELYRSKLNKINPSIILSTILMITPYEIISENFSLRQGKVDSKLISVQIEKAINIGLV